LLKINQRPKYWGKLVMKFATLFRLIYNPASVQRWRVASRQGTMNLWPLEVYVAIVGMLVVTMLSLSFVLGQRHQDRATGSPYESGILSEGSARVRFPAKFYLVAMFFVIFDVEAVFLFAWAVAVRETGWAGYAEVLLFITVLLATLAYLWRVGALDWRQGSRRTVS
jgi:NADH-quinone oxidoreductase subunit A